MNKRAIFAALILLGTLNQGTAYANDFEKLMNRATGSGKKALLKEAGSLAKNLTKGSSAQGAVVPGTTAVPAAAAVAPIAATGAAPGVLSGALPGSAALTTSAVPGAVAPAKKDLKSKIESRAVKEVTKYAQKYGNKYLQRGKNQLGGIVH